MALFRGGRYGEAVDAFREAVQLKDDFAEAWLNIGVNSFRLKRYEEANEAYARAIELEPENAMFRATYGYFLTQTRQTEEARRQLEKALELAPEYAPAHNNLAWYYCMGDPKALDPDKALYHSQKAVEFSGPHPPENILNTRAEALSAAGKYEEAMALNARLKEAHPDNPYYDTQRKRFESNWFLDEERRKAADEQRAEGPGKGTGRSRSALSPLSLRGWRRCRSPGRRGAASAHRRRRFRPAAGSRCRRGRKGSR
jgi:tetratricopeptide (TPR) repeat protein